MKKRTIIALIITIILIALILHKVNWHELIQTFKLFDIKNLLPISFLYTFALYLRGIRWKALLLNDKKYTFHNLGEIFIAGSLLNAFLPARAGDLYRAYYLGHIKQEKKMKVLGSVILERAFDGFTVFLFLLAAVILYCRQEWILHLTYIIGGLFVGCILFFYLIFKFNKVDYLCDKFVALWKNLPDKISSVLIKITEKICSYTNDFIQGFEVLNSIKYTFLTFVWSVIIWGIECYTAYLIISSFDLGLGFAAGMFVISLTSFSTMIPSTSVFIGPYQYAYILALGIFGIDKSAALAVSTVHQGILVIVLTIVGGILLLKFNNNEMKDFYKKENN